MVRNIIIFASYVTNYSSHFITETIESSILEDTVIEFLDEMPNVKKELINQLTYWAERPNSPRTINKKCFQYLYRPDSKETQLMKNNNENKEWCRQYSDNLNTSTDQLRCCNSIFVVFWFLNIPRKS